MAEADFQVYTAGETDVPANRGTPAKPGDALRRRTVEMTVIALDPSVVLENPEDPHRAIVRTKLAIPADRVEPGPRSHRFHVVDYDTTERKAYPPAAVSDTSRRTLAGWQWIDRFEDEPDSVLETNPAFRAQNVWVIAMRTLDNFERALGRRLSWSYDGHHLYLVPAAFAEPNAYYASEDHAVLFGYVPRRKGPPVYTSLAHDVVAHEVTHAILDGIRPRLAEPSLPDQAAFHEAMADISALLSILSVQELIEDRLGDPDADGRISEEVVDPEQLKGGVLLSLAKQLGATLAGDRRAALRRSAGIDPNDRWQNDPAYAEPHKRGEIIVAAVTQAFLSIWVDRLKPLRYAGKLDRRRAAEEGAKAASHVLTMCIRAIDYTPPVELEMSDFLDALIVADEMLAPDDPHDYRGALRKAFNAFGIFEPAQRIVDLTKTKDKLVYGKLNFDALQVDPDEIYRFIWQNAPLLGIDLTYHLHVERVRHAVRVGPDGLIVSEILADYVQQLDANAGDLKGLGIEVPERLDAGTPVQLWGGGVLIFDQFAKARLHQTKPLIGMGDDLQISVDRQSRRLAYLTSRGYLDSAERLGFSYGERRGQRFSALHSSAMREGEAW